MGRNADTGEPLQEPDGLTAVSDPAGVHADQVDAGGLDLASLVHQMAKTLCDEFGKPCGCQPNLPDGLCIATNEPCRFAVAPGRAEGRSGKPYASDVKGAEKPGVAGKPGKDGKDGKDGKPGK